MTGKNFFRLTATSITLVSLLLLSCTELRDAAEPGIKEADELIEQAMRDDLFTGAVLLIAEGEEILHHRAYGFASLYDERLRVIERPDSTTTNHLFDLASLTKIFATTYGMMALHSDGLISVDDRLSAYFPEFVTVSEGEITLRHLLAHTSGLLQWHPTWYEAGNAEDRRRFIAGRSLQAEPGERRRYSDLGFMLLADVIEAVAGTSLNNYLDERIYSRIGLEKTVFNPLSHGFEDIVSTSHGNPFEKKMVYEPGFGYNVDVEPDSWQGWREYTLRGEVNDGNAWYTHGGVAGHAGLFSTAEELHKLLMIVVNGGVFGEEHIFNEETIRLFTEKGTFGNGLGWAMQESVIHGKNLPVRSVGHTGFTGTSFILDMETGRMVILLSNRQHVGVNDDGMYPDLRELREQLSKLVFGS